MAAWRPLLARAAVLWLPLVVAATGLAVLVAAAVQQAIRSGANMPQIQLAEDAAAKLDAGAAPASVLPTESVNMAQSLAPYLLVFDAGDHLLASSVTLHGQAPVLPPGVVAAAHRPGGNRVTWQPAPGVRSAVVAIPWHDGVVVAGRSLRIAEEQEDNLRRLVLVLWLGTLAATAVAAVVVRLVFPVPGRITPLWQDGVSAPAGARKRA